MGSTERPSLGTLARALDVSTATVSRALRGDPRVTAATRARVAAAAAAQGYTPDPRLSRLMQRLRCPSRVRPPIRIAVLTYDEARDGWQSGWRRELLAGLRARAVQMRIEIAVHWLHDPTRSLTQLAAALRAEGVQGAVLLSPRRPGSPLPLFPWRDFSVVALSGEALLPAPLVQHDHAFGMRLALERCAASGHRRIGLLLPGASRRPHPGAWRAGERWLAAFLSLAPEIFPHGHTFGFFGPHDGAPLAEWLDRESIDAAVCPGSCLPPLGDALARLGRRPPREFGVVSLNLDGSALRVDGRYLAPAGVAQRARAMGAVALETLVHSLFDHSPHEERNFTLLLPGSWQPGATLVEPNAPVGAASPAASREPVANDPLDAPAEPPPDLSALARRLGLSHSTVSRALRHRPGVAAATRARILAAVAATGFTLDAGIAAIRLHRPPDAQPRHEAPFAVLPIGTDPDEIREPWRAAVLRGFAQSARRFGRGIEVFHLADRERSHRRIASILHARGVRGVLLLPPLAHAHSLAAFPWHAFAAVAVGSSPGWPIATVEHDRHDAVVETLLHGRRAGYRRVGLATVAGRAGVAAQHGGPHADWIGAFRMGANTLGFERAAELRCAPGDAERLGRWLAREQLDLAIAPPRLLPALAAAAEGIGRRVPETLGLAVLGAPPAPTLKCGERHLCPSHIDQMPERLGRLAAETLASLVQFASHAAPARIRTLQLRGRWVPGETLRAGLGAS